MVPGVSRRWPRSIVGSVGSRRRRRSCPNTRRSTPWWRRCGHQQDQSEHDVTGFLVAPTNSSEPVATDSQPDTPRGRRGGRAHKTHRRAQICEETTGTRQAPGPETPRRNPRTQGPSVPDQTASDRGHPIPRFGDRSCPRADCACCGVADPVDQASSGSASVACCGFGPTLTSTGVPAPGSNQGRP
jgi:hypothetical protein